MSWATVGRLCATAALALPAGLANSAYRAIATPEFSHQVLAAIVGAAACYPLVRLIWGPR